MILALHEGAGRRAASEASDEAFEGGGRVQRELQALGRRSDAATAAEAPAGVAPVADAAAAAAPSSSSAVVSAEPHARHREDDRGKVPLSQAPSKSGKKAGGGTWFNFLFGKLRGVHYRHRNAIQLAQSFGTPNQPGKPGPVIGVVVCKGPRNELQGLVVATPRVVERYLLDGRLQQRVALPEPLTCFVGGRIGGVGRVLLCGTQGGRVFILKAETFEQLLELDCRPAYAAAGIPIGEEAADASRGGLTFCRDLRSRAGDAAETRPDPAARPSDGEKPREGGEDPLPHAEARGDASYWPCAPEGVAAAEPLEAAHLAEGEEDLFAPAARAAVESGAAEQAEAAAGGEAAPTPAPAACLAICSLTIKSTFAEFVHFVIAGNARGHVFIWQVPSTKLVHFITYPVERFAPETPLLASHFRDVAYSSSASSLSPRDDREIDPERAPAGDIAPRARREQPQRGDGRCGGAEDDATSRRGAERALAGEESCFEGPALRPAGGDLAGDAPWAAEREPFPGGPLIQAVGSVAEIDVSDDTEEEDAVTRGAFGEGGNQKEKRDKDRKKAKKHSKISKLLPATEKSGGRGGAPASDSSHASLPGRAERSRRSGEEDAVSPPLSPSRKGKHTKKSRSAAKSIFSNLGVVNTGKNTLHAEDRAPPPSLSASQSRRDSRCSEAPSVCTLGGAAAVDFEDAPLGGAAPGDGDAIFMVESRPEPVFQTEGEHGARPRRAPGGGSCEGRGERGAGAEAAEKAGGGGGAALEKYDTLNTDTSAAMFSAVEDAEFQSFPLDAASNAPRARREEDIGSEAPEDATPKFAASSWTADAAARRDGALFLGSARRLRAGVAGGERENGSGEAAGAVEKGKRDDRSAGRSAKLHEFHQTGPSLAASSDEEAMEDVSLADSVSLRRGESDSEVSSRLPSAPVRSREITSIEPCGAAEGGEGLPAASEENGETVSAPRGRKDGNGEAGGSDAGAGRLGGCAQGEENKEEEAAPAEAAEQRGEREGSEASSFAARVNGVGEGEGPGDEVQATKLAEDDTNWLDDESDTESSDEASRGTREEADAPLPRTRRSGSSLLHESGRWRRCQEAETVAGAPSASRASQSPSRSRSTSRERRHECAHAMGAFGQEEEATPDGEAPSSRRRSQADPAAFPDDAWPPEFGYAAARGLSREDDSPRRQEPGASCEGDEQKYVGGLLTVAAFDQLWIGYGDGAVAVFALNDYELLQYSKLASPNISRMEFSKYAEVVLILSGNQLVTVWSARTLQCISQIPTWNLTCGMPLAYLYVLEAPEAWESKVTIILAGCMDGSISVRRLETAREGDGMQFVLIRNYVREVEPQVPISAICIDSWLNAAFVGDASGVVFTLPYVFQLLDPNLVPSAALLPPEEARPSSQGSSRASHESATEQRASLS
ncbi:hypothetical protein BESB_045660 [Besnoitia besnoiti]|uniref:Uncharacterized protein n=1 Tax=Besnoitia besnoiti TaxID=94643 RepID=A0A2A9MGU4_BESBE|nr:hypothetical protein BESB_045660 [Besnoitia besnoiti]PFH36374.1 hypothetical protein BESB_045660 [Besnoitia besnoiti]